ncbi:hypothetical protein HQ535_14720 [bacterium]|nr:hypothetical protein [bacterium]
MAALAPAILVLALVGPALDAVDDGCVTTPTGIDCTAGGTTTTTVTIPGGTSLPLRWLRVGWHPDAGDCWYWATTPPGLDSWDSANDHEIILTRWALPHCPGTVTTGPGSVEIHSRAWQVFRAFPLAAPAPHLAPDEAGITGLATILTAAAPSRLVHNERLPDGSTLKVTATVASVVIDWGDETPVFGRSPGSATRGVEHIYSIKTCPPAYRETHPAGHRCHPTLTDYPIVVTFHWFGAYSLRGEYTTLGTIERTTIVPYDVDEVIGVPSS